jgi:hypothetical protein
MSATVQLNGDSQFRSVEIENVRPKLMLTPEFVSRNLPIT